MSDARTPAGRDPAERRRHRADDERSVMPSRSADDTDVGWGDEPSERDDDWYRRERPPHHGG